MASSFTSSRWIIVIILSCIIALSYTLGTGHASAVSSKSCPGSPALTHAKCDMTIYFPSSFTTCDVVQAEIVARLKGTGGWGDPHNQGTYTLLESTSPSPLDGSSMVRGSRETGDGKYTDKFGFNLIPSKDGEGCEMSGCSESQVLSILDMSTNYCNLRSLYCNSSDGCNVVSSELDYTEKYLNCWQRHAENCIAGSSIVENA